MSAKAHNAPAIAFWEAMSLFCPGKQGEISTIGEIPSHLFARMARRAAQTARDPQACNKDLDGLDWREKHDRWYAILALEQHHATPFYSRMYVDARSDGEQERDEQ